MKPNPMATTPSNTHYHSDIPPGAKELEIKLESYGGPDDEYRAVELLLNGQVVGKRMYNESGILILEEPIRDGSIQGTVYWWNDEGFLDFLEPYHEGLMHGTAIQFDPVGNVVGTYTMNHGTGYDIWRQPDEDGVWHVAEIHSWKNGCVHGYERWLFPDKTLWHERHWWSGLWHGIERMWNAKGRLQRGYPQYWVENEKVNKRQYMKACLDDPSLPPYRAEDDLPIRIFPDEIVFTPIHPPIDSPRFPTP